MKKYLIMTLFGFNIAQDLSGVTAYCKKNCQALKNYLKHGHIHTLVWQVSYD
jgi:hypothetical protein